MNWMDLKERLERADRELREMADGASTLRRSHLLSKAQGVGLALSYMGDYGREVPTQYLECQGCGHVWFPGEPPEPHDNECPIGGPDLYATTSPNNPTNNQGASE